MEFVLIFIIFLGPLIFFHELGHFLFARFFGVRVEVFSLGFGPKLLKYKKGDTEYCISAIPLGGYVKMYGDDPFNKEKIKEPEKSFLFKSKWARFWIVFGGPLANFILAFLLFYTIALTGSKIPGMRFGAFDNNGSFYKWGLLPGDTIVKVNGKDVVGPSDIGMAASHSINSFQVLRGETPVDVKVDISVENFFENFQKLFPSLRSPMLTDKTGATYYVSAKRDGPDTHRSLESILLDQSVSSIHLFTQDKRKESFTFVKTISFNNVPLEQREKTLRENGLISFDLVIKSVQDKSTAKIAGLKSKDIITKLNGVPIYSFIGLKSQLQKVSVKTFPLTYLRDGVEQVVQVTPKDTVINKKKVKLIGIISLGNFLGPELVQVKSLGPIKSVGEALGRTWDGIKQTVNGFISLVTRKVSLKNLGGPIAIGQAAVSSFNLSLSYFFKLMAIISISLGVINLFPIPILDGGHIMFLLMEIINRGPVSTRKMEIAQQVGLSLLLLMTGFALYNDIARVFRLF